MPNVPLFGYSLFKTTDEVKDQTYYILSWLYCTNTLTEKLFQYTFYCINFGLAWDLLNSIRNPFESTETRYKAILKASPVLFILLFVYWGLTRLFGLKTLFQENPQCGGFRFDYMLAPMEITI